MVLREWIKISVWSLLLIVIVTIGAWCFHYDWKALYLYWKSRDFSVVTGQVVEIGMKSTYFMPKGDYRSRKKVEIKYRYAVNGREYIGDTLGTFSPIMTAYKAQDYLEKYRPGEKIIVLYDPKDPSCSLIERHFNTDTVLSVVTSSAIVLMFGTGLFYLYRIGIFSV